MNGWVHAATALGYVASPIVAIDVALTRRQVDLISTHWWAALEHPGPRAVLAGAWACVTVHLFRPEPGDKFRDSWATGAKIGLAVAAAVRCRA